MHKGIAVAAMFLASTAAAEERIYLYLSTKGPDGQSLRHRLECTDGTCKVEIGEAVRQSNLSDAQRKEILAAVQAEASRLDLGAALVSVDAELKLKIRYEAPDKRLTLERRLPAADSAGLSTPMREVLKTYLDLDLSKPQPPASAKGDRPTPAAKPNL